MKIQFTTAAIAAALLASAAPALAVQQYRIIDLGIPAGVQSAVARAISSNGVIAGEAGAGLGSNAGYRMDSGLALLPTLAGGTNFVTRGVNDGGVVAGTAQGVGIDDRAVLATTGSVTQLGSIAGFAAAGALDVNEGGVAVGYALVSGSNGNIEGNVPILNNAAGSQRAVVWNGGVGTELAAVAGSVNSIAVANNNSGQIAGNYRLANNRLLGVVWDGGVATTLVNPLGQTQARIRAISEAGWVTGQTTGSLGLVGTVWSPTTSYLLPLLGTTATITGTTRGINSAATVVGFSQSFDDITGDQVAQNHTLWTFDGSGFTAYDLSTLIVNYAGWDFSTGAAQAINDNGDIVGFATSADGFQHGYLLTAVPEPASWAMMIGGFGMIGGALRRLRVAVA
ncbi:MAG TPA: PEPxxWA-CTERM sorting domain-containing protein [Polymorphobacter sp.]|nr:PEPxxWA-CTERM sorting domain-containing protein [Polymorphobacter sp.]